MTKDARLVNTAPNCSYDVNASFSSWMHQVLLTPT